MVEAPMRAPLKVRIFSSSEFDGDTPTLANQSFRAVYCATSAPVKAPTVSVLMPLSQLIIGSVDATPIKSTS